MNSFLTYVHVVKLYIKFVHALDEQSRGKNSLIRPICVIKLNREIIKVTRNITHPRAFAENLSLLCCDMYLSER